MTMGPKVVVIGLDGGTLDLMNPWMDQGLLPTFAQMRKQGVCAPLRSTTPYYSAPAWVSMVTGCQPGKHGIYDFFRTDCVTKKIVNSTYRKVPAIWNMLTNNEKNSIIVNVPGSYPPEKINGVMITGLLTPSPNSAFTYPPSIKNELTGEKLGIYELEQVAVDDIPKNLTAKYAPEKLAALVNQMTSSHAKVTMNLMKTHEWDFTMVVFRGTDDVQHLLWNRKDLILSCYKEADMYINQMMTLYPNAVFIIVSDHGFGKPKKYFYVNNALYNAGYLKTTTPPQKSMNTLLTALFDRFSKPIFHIIPLKRILRSSFGRKMILSGNSGSNIDMTQTKAMYHSVCSRGIRINLKGKYKNGIVHPEEYDTLRSELIAFLKHIRDPETKQHLVKTIYTSEEIYGSNAVNDPLDIIFDLHEEYGAQELLQPLDGLRSFFQSKEKQLSIVSPPGFYDWMGDHKPYGILFIQGPNIKQTNQIHASIVDIVPTILSILKTPIPESIDGNVLTDIFQDPPKITISTKQMKQKELHRSELQAINKLRGSLNGGNG